MVVDTVSLHACTVDDLSLWLLNTRDAVVVVVVVTVDVDSVVVLSVLSSESEPLERTMHSTPIEREKRKDEKNKGNEESSDGDREEEREGKEEEEKLTS